MKKRIFSLVLAVLLLPSLCLSALAYSGTGAGDGISWTVDDGYGLILSGSGAMENHSPAGAGWGSWVAKNVTIPTDWEVWERDITSILVKSGITAVGTAAFAHCDKSRSAVMEEGVESLGSWAFLDNESMTEVTIPASVTQIGSMPFYNCNSLADVYYGGTEAMWAEISIGRDNDALLNANIHFTTVPPEEDQEDGTGENTGDGTEDDTGDDTGDGTGDDTTQTPEDDTDQDTGSDTDDTEQKPSASKLGDLDGDGEVSYLDAMEALRTAVGLVTLPEEIREIADVDGDGEVSYLDAMQILRVAVGLDSFVPKRENFFDDEVDRGLMEYESVYLQQHLDFLGSGDYADILLVPGGLAGALSDTYEETWLNIINGSWTFLDKVKVALGDGEIELVNEYELLVSLVMQSTGGEDNFLGTYEEKYFNAILQLVDGLNKELKQAKTELGLFTGSAIKEVEELTNKLDYIIAALQQMEGVPAKEAEGLFGDAIKEVSEAFEKDFLKDNKELISNVKNSLGIAMDVTGLVSESISELMEKYVLYTAMTNASREWEKVWADIADAARISDEKVGPKLAEAIDHVLKQTKAYREDQAQAILNGAVTAAGTSLAEQAYSAAYSFFGGMVEKTPIGKAIREGLVQGVNLGNAFTNMDEIAAHGKLMAGYGQLAKIAFSVMRETGETLARKETYENALLFDMAFHIYKNTQLAAFESGINYCQAMITANASNPHLSALKAAEINNLLLSKLEWEGYKCHGITQVLNNGGNVVGWNDDVYYFRISQGAYDTSAFFAEYFVDRKSQNDLVVRAPDGTEKVLITTKAFGSIWICSNRLVYQKDDYSWYYMDLKEPGKEFFFTSATIIGHIPEQDMLVLQTANGRVYTSDTRGNGETLVQEKNTAIAIQDGYYYYCLKVDSDKLTFCRYSLEEKKTETLGTVTVTDPENSRWWAVLGGACVAEDGLYVLAGTAGGTGGNYFRDGSIYFLPFDGEVQLLVNKEAEETMLYLATETLEDGTEGNRYVYYFTGGVYRKYMSDGRVYRKGETEYVSRYHVLTGETQKDPFPIYEPELPFVYNGKALILEGGTEATVLLDAKTAQALGCGTLGFRADGSAAYIESADKVGNDWYIVMTESVEDPAESIPAYTDYNRVFTKLFHYSAKTGQWEEIHSY